MGRYIDGDIDGKCWVCVQPSNFMDRFGVTGKEPCYIEYYYTEEDLPKLQEELKSIEDALGSKIETMQTLYDKGSNFDADEILIEQLGITDKDISDFADYLFAKKVETYIIDYNECSFKVEY